MSLGTTGATGADPKAANCASTTNSLRQSADGDGNVACAALETEVKYCAASSPFAGPRVDLLILRGTIAPFSALLVCLCRTYTCDRFDLARGGTASPPRLAFALQVATRAFVLIDRYVQTSVDSDENHSHLPVTTGSVAICLCEMQQ